MRVALVDTAQRLGRPVRELIANDPEVLLNWAKEANVSQILTGYIPVLIWPYATSGFFKVKKQIPRIPQELGMPGC